jgi:hypothetical protein
MRCHVDKIKKATERVRRALPLYGGAHDALRVLAKETGTGKIHADSCLFLKHRPPPKENTCTQ